MQSLFSRTRTASSPNIRPKANGRVGYDEFGGRSAPVSYVGPDSTRRDKGSKTLAPSTRVHHQTDYEIDTIPDGSYLPLNLERPRNAGEGPESSVYAQEQSYGYLSYERHVVLGLEQVSRLVDVIADEVGTRGLTTPFIFSSLAVDLSSTAIRRIIRAFLTTCARPTDAEAEHLWREEARFSGPHELGTVLRWGLARVVRIVGGQEVRGLLAWDHYFDFRDSEMALRFPPGHFSTFLPDLPPVLRTTLLTLLSLLTRLTAHSAASGHTPPTLSPLFGPLLFGLGPAALAFHHAYTHYLRAVHATEHILLAFIRWQDTPSPSLSPEVNPGSAAALGVPTRLKDWIRGYPAMLPGLQIDRQKKDQAPQARPGARTVRVLSVRRNVRMYSSDLVKTSASWAERPKLASIGDRDPNSLLFNTKVWTRIAPPQLKLAPRYSDSYKKRMDLPATFHPDMGVTAQSTQMDQGNAGATDAFGLTPDKPQNSERFRNLADMRWGEFETLGFGGLNSDEKALQFDLTESARNARTAKRQTLSWNDFSSAGFTRTDSPLNDTLQFSTPLTQTISSWPEHSAELSKKLKKTVKALPPFGWDTEPVVGSEEVVEQSFLDVFCDLIYGGGWMDLERSEETDRDCNWALVEFKSLPVGASSTSRGSDPRTSTQLILYEEFVPFEYRQQLADGSSGKVRRLPSLFSPNKSQKQWKPATTLNGRPYVVGHVPPSANYREVEFENLIRGNPSATKIISASKQSRTSHAPSTLTMAQSEDDVDRSSTPRPGYYANSLSPIKPTTSRGSPDSGNAPAKRNSLFRMPGGIPGSGPGIGRKAGMQPSEYSSVEFETRLAGYSDGESSDKDTDAASPKKSKKEKRDSVNEPWVDIVVGLPSRRRPARATPKATEDGARSPKSPRNAIADPDLASEQVAHALAAMRASPALEDSINLTPARKAGYVNGTSRYDSPPVLRKSPYISALEDPDIDSVMPHPRKRPGYFDLHPERRPTRGEEHQIHLDTDSEVYGPPDDVVYGLAEIPHLPDIITSIDSSAPPFTATDISQGRSHPFETATANSQLPPKNGSSKTATLIEMYKERERETALANSPTRSSPSSRVPLRTASLSPSSVPVPVTPSPVVIPSAVVEPPEETPSEEPPALLYDDPGRVSPARYVHGAPLHNVVEEEEEE